MSYWDNVTEIYNKQTEKGIKEYGQILEDNNSLDAVERITMAQEELVDLLVYLEHIKAHHKDDRNDALTDIYNILHDDYKAPELKFSLIEERIIRARRARYGRIQH